MRNEGTRNNLSSAQTRLYNTLGRGAATSSRGVRQKNKSEYKAPGLSFLEKRGKSIENALGTTGASLVSLVDTATENVNNDLRQKGYKNSLNDIAKKYGYSDFNSVWDARDAAEAAGDTAKVNEIDNGVAKELQSQTAANSADATKAAKNWENYRKNSYVGQKINQDRGKFAGSAINTLSTAFDVMMPTAGIAANAVQGGIEGLADELEQSGFENFDAERAAQNALIGGVTGGVVGGLNKGISSSLAKRGGNLFKGGNALTRGINNLGSKTALGRVGSTVATGATRGAMSGAVGGATGGGLSAILNGEDVLQSALSGAAQGAKEGAVLGGAMSGANLALSKTPVMRSINEAGENWKNSGGNFNERLTNTLNSGDSAVGNWLNKKTQSNLLASAGNIGNRVQNVGDTTTVDPWDKLAQQSGYETYDDVIESYIKANPGVELNPNGAAGQILTWLDENPNTPTTAAGWAKKAGKRVLEDVNNSNLGNRIQKVNELPEDIQNLRINDNMAEIPEAEVVSKRNLTTAETLENQAPTVAMRTQPENEVIDLTKSFDNKGLSQITNRNKLQALGTQLQNAAETQKYSGIYDALDAKTAQRAADTNAPQRLADLGVRSQDYNEYAKTSTYVNKVISDLADKSGVKVNALDLPEQLSAESLSLPFNSESNLKTYNKAIRNIVADGSSPTEYSASQLLEASRRFGKNAATIKGNTEAARELRNAYTEAKYKLRDIATDALEKSGVTGDATNARIAQGLKDLGANEAVQDYYTEAVDGKAPTASDYIRRSALFEQARDMGTQIDAEKYTRSASKAPTNAMTRIWRASGLDQPVETLLKSTVAPAASKATNLVGKAIGKVGDVVAGTSAGGTDVGNVKIDTGTQTSIQPAQYDPRTQIFNAIGRTEGALEREDVGNAQSIRNLTSAIDRATTNKDMALENLAGQIQPYTKNNTAAYEALFGQPTQQQTTSETNVTNTNATSNPYFPETGDFWTDVIGDALAKSIDDNDVKLFAELYDMYQKSVANLQKSSSKDYSNPLNWNSSDRTKLLSAQDGLAQIDELERLYNEAGGGMGIWNGTFANRNTEIGNIFPAGQNYKKYAQSAGMAIVKNLVNLGVTEADAQRYLEFLPEFTDTQEQAEQKLATLRSIYQNQINNLYSTYGTGQSQQSILY